MVTFTVKNRKSYDALSIGAKLMTLDDHEHSVSKHMRVSELTTEI